MCALSAGRNRPQSGQRYVLGFVFAAGRIAYQRASRKSSPIRRRMTRRRRGAGAGSGGRRSSPAMRRAWRRYSAAGRLRSVIRLEPWGPGDRALLDALVGDPAMMLHLGGPETPERIAERQLRYEQDPRQLRIVDVATGEGVGWVGYWERDGDGREYEIGWSVLPAFQGRGIAKAATRGALKHAREHGDRRYVHAYPSVGNAPSNALCRSLGFTLLGPRDFEYPPGSVLRCNDWRLDLHA